MARTSYQKELATLRGEVGAMGDVVVDRYEEAVEVLQTGDERAAERLIEGDEELNEWYLDIESDCMELLALQQPVASDLRFVASSFKIVTDLERIGDLATNFAAYGWESGGMQPERLAIEEIAELAGEMVIDAMQAYARDDSGAARAVAARDDDLDERCRQASEAVVRELLTASETAQSTTLDERLENVSRVLLTIRDLERVGDHAVNICARTAYMVDNDDELLY